MNKLDSKLRELIIIFRKLRDPETGCPWDKEQDFKSIASCAIEESYEVADAIERNDFEDLKAELGDLLFQIVFHSEMAKEKGLFTIEDVIDELNSKLIRRHPHVFNDGDVKDAKDSLKIWEDVKAEERLSKNLNSVMDDVPKNLPSLTRTKKLQKRATRVGFDWSNSKQILEKIDEEIDELKHEDMKSNKEGITEEIGDVLFTLVRLAGYYELEPEDIIRKTNLKFENRFRKMENEAKSMKTNLNAMTLNELEILWQKVK
ncbi:MAG: nucleoside triphosphate pyrophosphohydrolase [Gammaproteobacteria bacterium]|nr:nucleoside triphosphate pyrophosphohydrolase [Gammaproteobacteria bacterium]